MIIRDVTKTGAGGKDIGTIDEMTFQVVHIDKIITLRAITASDKRQWMKILESTIQQAEKQMAAQSSQDMAVAQKSDRRMIGTLEFKVLEAKKLAGSEKIRKSFDVVTPARITQWEQDSNRESFALSHWITKRSGPRPVSLGLLNGAKS